MENNKSLVLKGVHGTCQSSAECIFQTGFQAGKGRRGTGAYFWSSNETDHTYAIELAVCYAEDMKHLFKGKADKKIVALVCDVLTTKSNFLDLEQDSKNRLFTAYVHQQKEYLAESPVDERKARASKVADDFVILLEESTKLEFDVIHAQVQSPRSYIKKLSVPERWLHTEKQGCYIVRNLTCIPQDKIKAA
jgi:hypothetical protein